MSEKGREVYHPLMASAESRARLYLQCLSPWRQLLTSAPAQGNPNLHQGIREEKSATAERRASPVPLPLPVRPGDQKKKKEEEVGRGRGG